MSPLSAGEPIETPRHAVGRRVTLLADPARDAKLLGVDIWYPAAAHTSERSEYELLPGVTFRAAAAQPDVAPAAGRFPLVVFSHGRTGMRFAYSLLCEALAARGAVVVSADHAGDTLADFLMGTFVVAERLGHFIAFRTIRGGRTRLQIQAPSAFDSLVSDVARTIVRKPLSKPSVGVYSR